MLLLRLDDASMQFSRFFFVLAALLAPVALLGTLWLYLYPAFHGCSFPTPPAHVNSSAIYTYNGRSIAPFRLLALGDPQLEGDSSLPNPNAPIFPSMRYFVQDLQHGPDTRTRVRTLCEAYDGVRHDSWVWLKGRRKAVDLWGNDLYLAHIVRTTRWWSQPSHVAVLGDLLGSQWITDGEFEKRAGRYWDVVMKGLRGVPRRVYGMSEEVAEEEEKKKVEEQRNTDELPNVDENSKGHREDEQAETIAEEKVEEERKPLRKPYWGGTTEVLGADDDWAKRVINIAGNHDVGYAGDLDVSRVERFEKAFGNVNWDIWFTLPPAKPDSNEAPPALRVVILNSMNIDTPAWSDDLQAETYSFMNHIITTARPVEDKTHATILLTHIPLEKQLGVCVDSPYFDFFDGGHGVKEQNMLSDFSSKTILQGMFGMSENRWAAGGGLGRRGIVLNGHDHEGCDVVHFIPQEGVEHVCAVDTVKSEDAYWPAITSVASTEAEAPIGTVDALMSSVTSSVNDTNPLIDNDDQTSPAAPAHAETRSPPIPDPEPSWLAHPFPHRPYHISQSTFSNTSSCIHIASSPHIREITLRSMMGDFSGHAGFLSAWFDQSKGEKGEWVFEFRSCGVGVQHWWWGVHSVDFALCATLAMGCFTWIVEKVGKKEGGKKNKIQGSVDGKEHVR